MTATAYILIGDIAPNGNTKVRLLEVTVREGSPRRAIRNLKRQIEARGSWCTVIPHRVYAALSVALDRAGAITTDARGDLDVDGASAFATGQEDRH